MKFSLATLLSVVFFSNAAAADIAYVFANDARADVYTANATYTNNRSIPVTIKRVDEGRYVVNFNRALGNHFGFSVTKYGPERGYCGTSGAQASFTSPYPTVGVQCYDDDGRSVDSQFLLTHVSAGRSDGDNLRYGVTVGSSHAYDLLREQQRAFEEGRRTDPPEVGVEFSSSYPVGATGILSTSGYRVFPTGEPQGPELNAVNHVSTIGLGNCFGNDLFNINSFSTACNNDLPVRKLIEAAFYVQYKKALGHHSALTARVQRNLSGGREAMVLTGYTSDGSAQSVTRVSTGRYEIEIGPEAIEGGHVQLSSDWQARCRVEHFADRVVNIACSSGGIDYDPGEFTISAIKPPELYSIRPGLAPLINPEDERDELRDRLLRETRPSLPRGLEIQ